MLLLAAVLAESCRPRWMRSCDRINHCCFEVPIPLYVRITVETQRLHQPPCSLLQSRNLCHDRGCFLFERGAHGLIVRVRHLAGFVFEIQIAQVLVDRFLALAKIAEPRFFFSGVDFAGKEENVVESGGGDDGADERDHRVISLGQTSSLDRSFSRTRVSAPHLPLFLRLIVIGRSLSLPCGGTHPARYRAGW